MRRWLVALAVVTISCVDGGGSATPTPSSTTTTAAPEPTTTPTPAAATAAAGPLLYRLDGQLYAGGVALGVSAAGPARWRPGHPSQVTYGVHSSDRSAGVFLFEQVRVHDIESGEDRLLLDVADHGWPQAGHFDWDRTGSRLVLAAEEEDGRFRPQVLDEATGEVTRVPTEGQIIDPVFTDDGRILAVDTSGEGDQSEVVAWVGEDGAVTPLPTSEGVNRDPAASPDGRYVANIRATGPLSRVGLGRWDLVITDLEASEEWVVGDGRDGFGPPRWVDAETVVAKHARYGANGVVASIPDVVLVTVASGEITAVDDRSRAWDPDPRR